MFAYYFSILPWLEFISIIISIAIIVGIILIIIKTGWYTARVDRIQDVILKTNAQKKRAQTAWKEVELHFFAGNDNDLKVAIIQADQILSDALRNAGVRGHDLGDRLKNLKKDQVPNLDELWQAHKLRNQIAHESGFKLKRDVAERALNIYEKTLQNLGALKNE